GEPSRAIRRARPAMSMWKYATVITSLSAPQGLWRTLRACNEGPFAPLEPTSHDPWALEERGALAPSPLAQPADGAVWLKDSPVHPGSPMSRLPAPVHKLRRKNHLPPAAAGSLAPCRPCRGTPTSGVLGQRHPHLNINTNLDIHFFHSPNKKPGLSPRHVLTVRHVNQRPR